MLEERADEENRRRRGNLQFGQYSRFSSEQPPVSGGRAWFGRSSASSGVLPLFNPSDEVSEPEEVLTND